MDIICVKKKFLKKAPRALKVFNIIQLVLVVGQRQVYMGWIMYKWIAAESELKDNIWAGLPTVDCQASPKFILQ